MCTNAYISLHNRQVTPQKQQQAVTFRRQKDGFMGEIMAEMFYSLFTNPYRAKGHIEALICADPSAIEFHSMGAMDKRVCNTEFHYHLDCQSLELTVLNHEYWNENGDVSIVFNDRVDRFINQFSREVKSIVTRCHSDDYLLQVYTREGMINDIFNMMSQLAKLHECDPNNPVIKAHCKEIDRFSSLLSDMALTSTHEDLLHHVQQQVIVYQLSQLEVC